MQIEANVGDRRSSPTTHQLDIDIAVLILGVVGDYVLRSEE